MALSLRAAALAAVAAAAAAHETSIAEMWASGEQIFTHGVGGPNDPEQISIAFGATPDAMTVTWVTPSATNTDNVVNWDYVPSRYGNNVTGSATSYTTVGYASGAIHSATVTGLQAGLQVYYRVGGASGWSADLSFVAPRGVGAGVVPYTFAAIGDLGQTANSNNTIYHVLGANADSAFITGDISYADSDQPRWDSFGRLLTPLGSAVPVMMAPGNHEEEVTIPPFKAYDTRYAGMPFPAGSSGGPQWYSYEAGPAHTIILNSFADFSAGSDQAKWFAADLAAINRARTPWVFLIVHAPWYNSNKAHHGDGENMRLALEAAVHGAQIAVCFAGHVHAYERSFPAYNNKVDATGTVYITIGDGGNREGLYTNWISPQPATSAFRQAEYGHGILTIANATAAAWSWHRNADAEPVITDSVTITNPYTA